MTDLVTTSDDFIVLLDSRKASTYFNDSFHSHMRFDFEQSIFLNRKAIKVECSVLQFDCPNSLYIINEYNSVLALKIGSETVFTQYSFTYGNYNARTFMTHLILLLGNEFSISLDPITNRFTLSHKNSEFQIDGTNSTCFNVMGFDNSTIYSSSGFSFLFPFTCNFNGIQNLNIEFANISTRNIDSTNCTRNSIIGTIPIDPTSNVIHYFNQAGSHFNINQDVIDYIDIRISDNLFHLVNLNNQHFTLVLQFKCMVDLDRFAFTNSFGSILKGKYSSPKIPFRVLT